MAKVVIVIEDLPDGSVRWAAHPDLEDIAAAMRTAVDRNVPAPASYTYALAAGTAAKKMALEAQDTARAQASGLILPRKKR